MSVVLYFALLCTFLHMYEYWVAAISLGCDMRWALLEFSGIPVHVEEFHCLSYVQTCVCVKGEG